MSNQLTKQEILDAIQMAQAKGYTLVSEDWGSAENKCACALSCVLLTRGVDLTTIQGSEDAAEALQLSENWVSNFVLGFDYGAGEKVPYEYREAYQLGCEIREATDPV